MDIEKIQKNVLATLKVEGLNPSKYGLSTTKNFLEGRITSQEAIEKITSYWLKQYKNLRK